MFGRGGNVYQNINFYLDRKVSYLSVLQHLQWVKYFPLSSLYILTHFKFDKTHEEGEIDAVIIPYYFYHYFKSNGFIEVQLAYHLFINIKLTL